jgi:hypothetical protein
MMHRERHLFDVAQGVGRVFKINRNILGNERLRLIFADVDLDGDVDGE